MQQPLSRTLIEFRGVSKSYKAVNFQEDILFDVNFRVGQNEIISIQGQSGSGKTSLLNLISQLDTSYSGDIFWNDINIRTKSEQWRNKFRFQFISMIFQNSNLIGELNVLENILLAIRVNRKLVDGEVMIARNLLECLGLENKKYSTVNQLSGGEKQRVAIARALISSPKIILADEPTGNLDKHTGDNVMRLLIDICQQRNSSLILVTHNNDYARLMTKQFIIYEKKLLRVN